MNNQHLFVDEAYFKLTVTCPFYFASKLLTPLFAFQMDNLASLQTLYSIVITIVSCSLTYFLFRKESFFLCKPVSLVLLVGDIDSSRKRLRKSDATFQSGDTLEDAHQCVLHFPSLNRKTLEFLLVKHPNVTHLTLSASGLTVLTANASLPKIGDLLYGWKSSLLSLKLILCVTHLPGNQSSLQMSPSGASELLGVINEKLTYLEHLTLSSNSRLLPHGQFHLSILSRLRSFTLCTADPVSWLIPSFCTYATRNETLECIQMDNYLPVGCAFPELTPHLWSKFSHLSVANWKLEPGTPVDEWPFLSYFSHLSNLTYLDLGIQFTGRSEYSSLMATLAVLQQLTTLALDIDSESTCTLHREETHPPQVLPELANIRQLRLNMHSYSHDEDQVALFFIDAIFPRLHRLMVHFEAQYCVYCCASDDTPATADIVQNCARELYKQVAQVSVGQKKVTFQWKENGNIWTPAQLGIQE